MSIRSLMSWTLRGRPKCGESDILGVGVVEGKQMDLWAQRLAFQAGVREV